MRGCGERVSKPRRKKRSERTFKAKIIFHQRRTLPDSFQITDAKTKESEKNFPDDFFPPAQIDANPRAIGKQSREKTPSWNGFATLSESLSRLNSVMPMAVETPISRSRIVSLDFGAALGADATQRRDHLGCGEGQEAMLDAMPQYQPQVDGFRNQL